MDEMDEFTDKLKELAIQEFLDGHNIKYIATSLTFRINEHVDERDVLEIISLAVKRPIRNFSHSSVP